MHTDGNVDCYNHYRKQRNFKKLKSEHEIIPKSSFCISKGNKNYCFREKEGKKRKEEICSLSCGKAHRVKNLQQEHES